MKKQKLLVISASLLACLCVSCASGDTSSSASKASSSAESSVSASTSLDSSSEASSASSSISSSDVSSISSSSESSSSSETSLDEIQTVINNAVSKANLISNGTIEYGYESPLYGDSETDTITFEFGSDSNGDVLHYQRTQWGTTYDFYIMKDSNGNVVSVRLDDSSNITKPYSPDYETVNFPFNYIFGYSTYFFGTEELVSEVFAIAKTDSNQDLKILHEEANEYALNFGYLYTDSYGDNTYYELRLDFTIGSEGEFETAYISSTTYSSSSYDVDPELNTVIVKSDAVASSIYSYNISQTTGTRSFVNPYNIDDFYATSFDLTYEGEVVTSDTTIELEAGNNAYLSLENILPSTTNFSFDSVNVSVISGDEDGISADFSSYSKKVSVYAETEGTYTIQVTSSYVTKTFNVTVTPAAPTSISVNYSTYGVDEYNSNVCTDEISVYSGVEVVLQTNVLPYTASQSVTATVISAPSGATYSFAKREVQINSWTSAECDCFSSTTVGDYTIRFACDADSDIYQDVVIHVTSSPTFAELFENDYAAKARNANYEQEVKYYFSFTPTGTGETGTVTIEDRFNDKTEIANYEITQNDSIYDVTLTHISGDELNLSLKIGADFSMKMYESDDESGTGKTLSIANFAFLASGTYSGSSDDMSLSLSLGSTGEVTFNMYNSSYTVYEYFEAKYEIISQDSTSYTVEISESQYTDQDNFTLPMSFTIDSELTTISLSFDYNGITYTFTLTR